MHPLWVKKAQRCPFKGTAPVRSYCTPKGTIFARFFPYSVALTFHSWPSSLHILFANTIFYLFIYLKIVSISFKCKLYAKMLSWSGRLLGGYLPAQMKSIIINALNLNEQ